MNIDLGDAVDGPIGSKVDYEYLEFQILQLQRIVGVFGIPGPLLWNHEQPTGRKRSEPRLMMGYDA